MGQRKRRPAVYRYSKLSEPDEPRSAIRLLLLDAPKSADSALTGTIKTYSFPEVLGAFEALSYRWGEAIFPNTIYIDGKALKITKNLYHALRRLRNQVTRFLWIDAICINQDDLQERTAQVAIMDQIYSAAKRTLVWLGEPEDGQDAEAVFDFFRREARRFRELDDGTHAHTDNHDPEKRCVLVAERQKCNHHPQVSWPLVQDFLQHDYFRRRWVIQEILLAREAFMFWGTRILLWKDFSLCLRRFKWGYFTIERFKGFLKGVAYNSQQGNNCNILSLLYRFQDAACSNARDRIGALQGLWQGHDVHLRSFSINYLETTDINYLRFARALSTTSECGLLLYLAATANYARLKANKMTDLPSWVPDWRFLQSSFERDDLEMVDVRLEHEPVTTQKSGDRLALKGWIVDEIIEHQAKHNSRLKTSSGLFRWRRCIGARAGDRICVFMGGRMRSSCQYVLSRSTLAVDTYKLVGRCEFLIQDKGIEEQQRWNLPEEAMDIVLV